MKKTLLIVSLALVSSLALAGPGISGADRERAAALVAQMTLDEKIDFIAGKTGGFSTYGIPRLGIPALWMADGPQGVRNIGSTYIQSTFYPCGMSAAASWNRDAMRQMGAGIGCAAKAHGVSIMLGPGVNIYRSALCGRNFEYFGEDPYLTGELALSYIEGMQAEGVMATIKHFALNNQEYARHKVSSEADERTMNEIYFPAFRKAVEVGGVGAVMTSYNPVNGQHAAENPWLVRDNLRAWGHKGIVMSDWNSTYRTLDFLTSGVDLEMPGGTVVKAGFIKQLLENGVITEDALDEKCINILSAFSAFGFLDGPVEPDPAAEDPSLSQRRAYEIALEGPVLLKNEDGILPLKGGRKNQIVVMGPNANEIVCGGGSGWVNPEDGKAVTLVDGLRRLGKNWDIEVLGSPQPEVLKKASAVIVSLGFNSETEKEDHDRSYKLDRSQLTLLERVTAYTDKVIVVVNSGGEFDLEPWKDKVKAIILDWYPGQEGGSAMAAILSGQVSPSGRLPFTFWGSLNANPVQKWYKPTPNAYAGTGRVSSRDQAQFATYGEGIFVGYRGVEHFGVQPLYPFGYGLTYSSFEYSDASVVPSGEGYDVSFTVRNTGKVAAKEVAQVYVSSVNPSVMRPDRELKGFDKQMIDAGATARCTIHLGPEAFSYYDVKSHSWKEDPGEYRILIGASSQNILLTVNLDWKRLCIEQQISVQ